MRILFVRHGEPDYEHDCLTPTGHIQAQRAAERLKDEGISAIYASPQGRAQQTASYTAEKTGLPIVTLDFMHEISWGNRDGSPLPHNANPWLLSWDMAERDGLSLTGPEWRKHPYFEQNIVCDCLDYVSENIDTWLAGLGYERRGLRYYTQGGNRDTVALFSHGGSSGCVLSHMLNIDLPCMFACFPFGFTSIHCVEMSAEEGFCVPRMSLFNDMAHLSEKDEQRRVPQR